MRAHRDLRSGGAARPAADAWRPPSGAVTHPPIPPMYTNAEYLERNPGWHGEDAPWKADEIHAFLADADLRPASVADVGCGTGLVLAHMAERMPADVSFTGYEPSPQAFAMCERLQGDRMRFLPITIEEEQGAAYDLVLCVDVIEHIPDVFGFLRALRPLGRHTVFHIPLDLSVHSVLRGALMEARTQVGYLHYFTRETALATLADAGFEVVMHRLTPVWRHVRLPRASWRWRYVRDPLVRVVWRRNPDLAARLFGGASLLVLAR